MLLLLRTDVVVKVLAVALAGGAGALWPESFVAVLLQDMPLVLMLFLLLGFVLVGVVNLLVVVMLKCRQRLLVVVVLLSSLLLLLLGSESQVLVLLLLLLALFLGVLHPFVNHVVFFVVGGGVATKTSITSSPKGPGALLLLLPAFG